MLCNLRLNYAHNMFCFIQDETGFLVECLSDVIEEMTPATADLELATLKEELISILDSNPFGKSLRSQEDSFESLPDVYYLFNKFNPVMYNCMLSLYCSMNISM